MNLASQFKILQTPVDDTDIKAEVCMARSRDLVEWDKLGWVAGGVSVMSNKDGVLIPGSMEGNYFLLHRPMAETWSPDMPDRLDQYRPMRSLAGRRYVYIWNAWSNGKNTLPREMGNGDEITCFLDSNIEREGHRDRSRFSKYRVPEELYNTETDPGCRQNLIHDTACLLRTANRCTYLRRFR